MLAARCAAASTDGENPRRTLRTPAPPGGSGVHGQPAACLRDAPAAYPHPGSLTTSPGGVFLQPAAGVANLRERQG